MLAYGNVLSTQSFQVGYLGPECSHSHQALQTLWTQCLAPFFHTQEAPKGIQLHPTSMAGIPELVQAVKQASLSMGLVPYENSLEGSVRESLEEVFFLREPLEDALTSPAPEVARLVPILEFSTRIEHCLAVHPAFAPKDLTGITVASHPMAFRQSRHTLKAYLGYLPMFQVASSTSAAAYALSQYPDEAPEVHTRAVVCSKLAVDTYGLKCLQAPVNDEPWNETRFILLASVAVAQYAEDWLRGTFEALSVKANISEASMSWKFPLCVRLKNRIGVLADCLQIFSQQGLDLTRIESVPLRRSLGEYRFHIDVAFPSQPSQAQRQRLLDALHAFCVEVQWLEPFICLGQL